MPQSDSNTKEPTEQPASSSPPPARLAQCPLCNTVGLTERIQKHIRETHEKAARTASEATATTAATDDEGR